MSAEAAQTAYRRPRLLFVDDEQRVLNSMRIMFRRQFDLFLASHGAEALSIVKDKDIDVIIADHRMPKMTGVEVLAQVRTLSPRTIRILLTGYADLDAVEGSINESEVFRFLTKPCAPKQLRETIELAAKLAREAPVPEAREELTAEETLEIVLESATVTTEISSQHGAVPPAALAPVFEHTATTDVIERPTFVPAAEADATTSSRPKLATGLGIVVFSSDDEVLHTVQKSMRGRLPVYQAGNIVHVVRILDEHRPGVLVTDISDDKATIQAMTARLKEHLPELVTIAVSEHRDVLDMVWLINHGQIFRFLRKPLSAGRCAISLQAALQHHRMLLTNPALVKRHEVDAADDSTGLVDGVLAKLKSMSRLWV
ncbi:MAG TPA: response regulator [Gammaproteobacteria bacterium]|nr:response regulator [Gammaproteobacteria bacterium]